MAQSTYLPWMDAAPRALAERRLDQPNAATGRRRLWKATAAVERASTRKSTLRRDTPCMCISPGRTAACLLQWWCGDSLCCRGRRALPAAAQTPPPRLATGKRASDSMVGRPEAPVGGNWKGRKESVRACVVWCGACCCCQGARPSQGKLPPPQAGRQG